MHSKSTAPIAMLLVIASGLACSMLRRKSAATWRLTLEVQSPTTDRKTIEQIIRVIEQRLALADIKGYDVHAEDPGSNRIIADLPSVPNHERVKRLITSGGKLELFYVLSLPSPIPINTYDTKEKADAFVKTLDAPATSRVLPYFDHDSGSNAAQTSSKWVIVKLPAIIDGSDLRSAQAVPGPKGDTDAYQIEFSLNKNGADKFGAWTAANINSYIAVALNDEVKSIAFIKGQIFDRGEINGRFTREAAEDLALVLRSGSLPAPLKIISEETIK